MKKILVIGSLNMDMVTKVANIPKAGETIMGGKLNYIPGGKGANQAATIGRLEGDVTMLGVVGRDDYGKTLIENLEANGIEVKYIEKTTNETTGLAFIMVNNDGNNSIVVISGANKEFKESIIDNVDISEFDIIVAQMEIPIKTIKYAFEKAKENDIYTILNPAPAGDLTKDILKNVDLLIPNETEFESLTKCSIEDENEINRGIEILMDKGVKEIIITLGKKGARYFDQKRHDFLIKTYDVSVVDTTGAGDSFIGAIATALSKGSNMKDSIEFAMKVASLTVGKQGAQSSLPDIKIVKEFKAKKYNK